MQAPIAVAIVGASGAGTLDVFHQVMGYASLLLNPFFALLDVIAPAQQGVSSSIPLLAGPSGLPYWLFAVLTHILVGFLALFVAVKRYSDIRKGER